MKHKSPRYFANLMKSEPYSKNVSNYRKIRIRGYVPPGKEYLMKCNWLDCIAGCGIAGHGGCFLKGQWWKKNCKQFKKDDLR